MKRLAQAFLLAALTFTMGAPSCAWFEKHPVIPAVVTCSGETIPLALVTQVYNDVMTDNWFDLATNVVPLLKDGYADIECIFGYLKVSNPETAPHIQKLKAQHADEFRGSVSMRSPDNSMAPLAAVPPGSYLGVGSNGQIEWLTLPARDLVSPLTVTSFKGDPWAGSGWMRVRGGALIRWSEFQGGWTVISLKPSDKTSQKESPAGSALWAPAGRALSLDACDIACGGKNTSLAPPSGCLCHSGKGMTAHWVAAR